MDLSTSSIDEAEVASKEQIILATREVKKAHGRNRKKRTKVFSHVVDYLDNIVPALYEQHKNYVMGGLVESMDELRELILEVFKLLLPLLEQGQLEGIQYDATNYATVLEAFVVHLKQWCITQESTSGRKPLLYFLDLTSQLMTGMIELIADSESWRYVECISTPVIFIILQWDEAGPAASDKLLRWTKSTAYPMNSLEKRISQCGDFDCQYFLVILVQHWLAWSGKQTAENYLEAAFPLVSLQLRRLLLKVQDFEYGGRAFLNALNSKAIRGPRAKGIFSIRCLYFFAGDQQLKPPEKCDQLWIDFSAISRRLHSFISIPGNPWIDLNIGSDSIESICVSWLRRGDGYSKSQGMSESCNQTQGFTQDDFSQKTNFSMESSCLMFLHVRLTGNFNDLNQDFHAFYDKDVRSLTLVFQDLSLVEQVLHQMCFPTHSNGEQCIRPQALLHLIRGPAPTPEPGLQEANHVEEFSPEVNDNHFEEISPDPEVIDNHFEEISPEVIDSHVEEIRQEVNVNPFKEISFEVNDNRFEEISPDPEVDDNYFEEISPEVIDSHVEEIRQEVNVNPFKEISFEVNDNRFEEISPDPEVIDNHFEEISPEVIDSHVEEIRQEVNVNPFEEISFEVDDNYVEEISFEVEDNHFEEISPEVIDSHVEEIRQEVNVNYVAEISQEANDDNLFEEISQEVNDNHVEEIRHRVNDNLFEEISQEVNDNHVEKISPEVDDNYVEEIRQTVNDNHVKEISPEVNDNYVEEIRQTVNDNLVEKIRHRVNENHVKEIRQEVNDNHFEEISPINDKRNKQRIKAVKYNPANKVTGRSRCYESTLSTSKSVVAISPSPPLTQFKDPYDITGDEDFLKEKLTKTYSSRTRKRKPVARSPRNVDVNKLGRTSSDEELDKLLQNLPASPVVKKKRGRPKKQETVPKNKPKPVTKPQLPKRKKKKLDDTSEDVSEIEIVPKKKPVPKVRLPLPQRKKKKLDDLFGDALEVETAPKTKLVSKVHLPQRKKKKLDELFESSPEVETIPKQKPVSKPQLPQRKEKRLHDLFESSPEVETIPKKKPQLPQMKEKRLDDIFKDVPAVGRPKKQETVPKKYLTPKPQSPQNKKKRLDDDDDDIFEFEEVPEVYHTRPSLADETFDWGNLDLGELENESSYGLFEQGPPTPCKRAGSATPLRRTASRASSICSNRSRRPSRPATPMPTTLQLPSLDDTFDWDNLDLD